MHSTKFGVFWLVLMMLFSLSIVAGCGDDDDDNDDNDDASADDDTDDDDDDDDGSEPEDYVPTTLDLTYIPIPLGDSWILGEGPGDPREIRNDLLATETVPTGGQDRLSLSYFMVLSDLHQTDEESPVRLTFFDALTILDGAFNSAFRPQEDLGAQLLNAMVRTANHIQLDYGRDFNFALALGDMTDNGQLNELEQFIDVLDGNGLTTGEAGWTSPDSGELDLDPTTGRNRGERNFGIQETDGDGNNINAFDREGYPNSNADLATPGLRLSNGDPLPWFAAVGNHDVLATGTFDPDSFLTFYKTDSFVSDRSPYGFIPGLGGTLAYWEENPHQKLYIGDGLFGMNIDWRIVIQTLKLAGQIPDDYSIDIDERFNLLTLTHNTPGDSSDDGVTIAADPDRMFMRHDLLLSMLHEQGHGFIDRNGDTEINGDDGGYYRLDSAALAGQTGIPLRLLVLDSCEILFFDDGGLSEEQFTWLESELQQAVEDQVMVILANHHYSGAIPNHGERLRSVLNSYPNVILHLVGHGHHNRVFARRAENEDPLYGYWEVETSSGIEFPQQSRIVEIVDNRDGTGSIFMTLFDTWPTENDDSDELALLGRELAFDDMLRRGYDGSSDFGGMGEDGERNVELVFQIPSEIVEQLADIPTDGPITSDEVLGTLYQ